MSSVFKKNEPKIECEPLATEKPSLWSRSFTYYRYFVIWMHPCLLKKTSQEVKTNYSRSYPVFSSFQRTCLPFYVAMDLCLNVRNNLSEKLLFYVHFRIWAWTRKNFDLIIHQIITIAAVIGITRISLTSRRCYEHKDVISLSVCLCEESESELEACLLILLV